MVWPDMVVTMSPGRCAFGARHVFHQRHDADDIGFRFAQRDRLHRAGDGGRAAHVALHFVHAAAPA